MNKDDVTFIRENRSVEYGDSDDWCDRATALCDSGRYEEALQAYEKALELSPDYIDVWYVSLTKFGRTGDILKVIHTLSKVVICAKLDPKQVVVKPGISCHYHNLLKMLDFKWIS